MVQKVVNGTAGRISRTSSNPEVVGRWLLTELVSPTGSVQAAAEARKRLLGLDNRGMYGRLALALDASVHGRVQTAASGFIDAFQAARE